MNLEQLLEVEMQEMKVEDLECFNDDCEYLGWCGISCSGHIKS